MYDIHLIGTGLTLPAHLTVEARDALRSARRVYHLTAFHAELTSLCDDVVDWKDLYLKSDDGSVYREMADILLEEARREPGVAFAVYGHPLVLVDTSQIVIIEGQREGLRINVVPGVSSIDVLLAVLQLDVGVAGLQVLEVNQMVSRRIRPNPHVACFVMQISAFGSTKLTKAKRNHPQRFRPLRDYLLQSYSPRHPAVLITCPFLPGSEVIRHMVTVGELDEASDLIHTGMTLYLPPAVVRDTDRDFDERIKGTDAVFDAPSGSSA